MWLKIGMEMVDASLIGKFKSRYSLSRQAGEQWQEQNFAVQAEVQMPAALAFCENQFFGMQTFALLRFFND